MVYLFINYFISPSRNYSSNRMKIKFASVQVLITFVALGGLAHLARALRWQ